MVGIDFQINNQWFITDDHAIYDGFWWPGS